MMDYRQGDIVLVNLNPKKGQEIGKIRPAIIISQDIQNREIDVVLVVPLSTNLIDDTFPYRVRISARDELQQESDALLYHIRAISKKRILKRLASLTKSEWLKIREGICEIV